MSIIVSNCQHCDEQQFQTPSCVHYTIFSLVKLDLFIRAMLLNHIIALEKNYEYASRTSCYVYDCHAIYVFINHQKYDISTSILV